MIARERLVDSFLELVKIDSPSGEEDLMAEEMVRRLKSLNVDVWEDDHGNVLGRYPVNKVLPIMLLLPVVGVITATKFVGDGSAIRDVSVGGASSIAFDDSVGAYWGADEDLQIIHDTSHSRIAEQGTGSLIISGSILSFYNQAKNETLAEFTENAGADLYFDDTKRFETTNTGVYITGIATASGLLVSQDSLVSNASTITGVLSVSDTTESTTKDTGAVLIEGGVGIEKNLNLGTTIKMDSTAGVITATIFSGVGEVIGIGSEGTPIGTGVSFIDFRSSTGTAFSCQPAVNGIATVTVTPGVSLGLAIALGG